MSNRDKKEIGKELFMIKIPANEIARILDVSATTVSNWTTAEGWHEERAGAISRKRNRMDLMGDLIDYQLEAMHQRVKANRQAITDDPEAALVLIDKGEVDALAKMFATIKGKELSWANIVGIVRELVEFINAKSPDLAKAIVPYSDDYLVTKREVMQQ
ncbi:hypothetical protein [Fibrisoma montanum]|nr:hypothetical protein [Fibrisoma montanum]